MSEEGLWVRLVLWVPGGTDGLELDESNSGSDVPDELRFVATPIAIQPWNCYQPEMSPRFCGSETYSRR